MKVYYWPEDRGRIPACSRSVAIGIFDGVHRGHRKILDRILGRPAPTVVTFDPHPGKILHPKEFYPTILMSLGHRLRTFEKMGVREVLVVRFNRRLSEWSHEKFLSEILLKRLKMRLVSVGHDFRFGYRGLGDRFTLESQGKKCGFRVEASGPLRFQGKPVSSTRIRRAIEKGELSLAGRMLGRPVSVYGTVVRGRGRGKKLGFPTANLNPHHEALPPPGVYAVVGFLGKKPLKGVIHIGEKPTFKDRQKSLEVHFFDFHNDIYGRDLELIFVARLRAIRRFGSVERLIKAIRADSAKARKILDKREEARYNFSQL